MERAYDLRPVLRPAPGLHVTRAFGKLQSSALPAPGSCHACWLFALLRGSGQRGTPSLRALRGLLLQHAALYQRQSLARSSRHTAETERAVKNATTSPPFCTSAPPSRQNRDLVSRERGKQARRQCRPFWCMVGDAAHWPQQQADASQTQRCTSCAFAGHGRCCHGWCGSFTAVFLPRRAGNYRIGEAGGKAIADALKTNTSLTSIDLWSKFSPCIVTFRRHLEE